ncbi:MFS transporter [Alloscardovia omnicolens]|uniref:Transporter, major facilitator family protein n=1 Tax=Alloscardovia omnicolens F0580 TaxID=1321816 RepID=U1SIX1_9BIFI|nr:MFS transporter [Alloscardovia omnicolens]ERH31868.1 transporter, major facilitator family protein [Alloscardovia omnicolens F0580]MBS6345764.1 MFS transporter [Alloscardovia omnicolens]MDK6249863.1 MFS transporter [Alloscardovia omnicolens]MDK6328060.1 MFS transporter [Alloscardovia omnicolens]MDK8073879.1 MFS transporter [Alloscardovia omnicolens]
MSARESSATSAAPAAPVAPAAPRSRGWLTNVSLLIGGQFISLFGSSLVQYAVWWDLALRSNSVITIMWATIFGMLPQALIAVFGGAWADRLPRRLLIVLPDAMIALVTLALAIGYATGNAQTWFVFLVLFIRSIGSGIQGPAVSAFVSEVTPTEHLMRVNSLNGTLQSVLTIVSPAISAVLIGRFALQSVLFVDVVTAVIGIVCILMIRGVRSAAVEHSESSSTLADIREGLRYTMNHAIVRRILIAFTLGCLICASPTMLCSIFVNRNFADKPFDLWFVQLTSITDKLGFFELTFGIGMVVGGMVMTAWGGFKRRMVSVGVGTIGLGIANIFMGLSADSLMASMWVYVISFVLFGLVLPLINAPTYTYMQERVEPSMQGRVFGLINAATSFSMPLGMLIAGPLSASMPIEWMFIFSGVLTILVGVWALWSNEAVEE